MTTIITICNSIIRPGTTSRISSAWRQVTVSTRGRRFPTSARIRGQRPPALLVHGLWAVDRFRFPGTGVQQVNLTNQTNWPIPEPIHIVVGDCPRGKVCPRTGTRAGLLSRTSRVRNGGTLVAARPAGSRQDVNTAMWHGQPEGGSRWSRDHAFPQEMSYVRLRRRVPRVKTCRGGICLSFPRTRGRQCASRRTAVVSLPS